MAFAKKDESIAVVKQANILRTQLVIIGTAPLVQLKFSTKAKNQMMANMAMEATEKKAKSGRPPREYAAGFVAAPHLSVASWNGTPTGIAVYKFDVGDFDATAGVSR